MIIEAGEILEYEIVQGNDKLVRIYIDEEDREDGSKKYKYKELVFDASTIDEVIANRVNKVKASLYKELREAEYPPMAEYLDAIVKGDVEAEEEYKRKCLEVKAKYPKDMA